MYPEAIVSYRRALLLVPQDKYCNQKIKDMRKMAQNRILQIPDITPVQPVQLTMEKQNSMSQSNLSGFSNFEEGSNFRPSDNDINSNLSQNRLQNTGGTLKQFFAKHKKWRRKLWVFIAVLLALWALFKNGRVTINLPLRFFRFVIGKIWYIHWCLLSLYSI